MRNSQNQLVSQHIVRWAVHVWKIHNCAKGSPGIAKFQYALNE